MPLVRDGKVAVADSYRRIGDGEPLPARNSVIVSAARLLAEPRALLAHNGAVGVLWPNDRNTAELAPYLDRLAVVALNFPNFRDGRAYSQARTLRERYRFPGELRATGDVLRDQFVLLHRAGFTAFEVAKAADADAFAQTLRRYSMFYQPAADGSPVVFRRRLLSVQQPSARTGRSLSS